MIDRPMLGAAVSSAGFRIGTAIDGSAAELRKTRTAVAAAKQGDRAALRFLYLRYSNNIYGYVRNIVHDDVEAEDVTQHVFVKLMTNLPSYNERDVPFVAWLLRIARNVAIDHLRANRVMPTDVVIEPELSDGERTDRMCSVKIALDALPRTQREVVILQDFVGLSSSETAVHMHRTESAVHGLHHRGRQAMQRELTRLGAAPRTRSPRQPTRSSRYTIAA